MLRSLQVISPSTRPAIEIFCALIAPFTEPFLPMVTLLTSRFPISVPSILMLSVPEIFPSIVMFFEISVAADVLEPFADVFFVSCFFATSGVFSNSLPFEKMPFWFSLLLFYGT